MFMRDAALHPKFIAMMLFKYHCSSACIHLAMASAQQEALLEVEIHSRCVVAPSSGPPCSGSPNTHASRLPLSWFDLKMRAVLPSRRILFYRKPDMPLEAVVERLKSSLAIALHHFFPLAGRFQEGPDRELSFDCNDKGADLIVASTRVQLPDFNISVVGHDQYLFPTLVPQPTLPPESPLVAPVSIQVTQFSCGSIAIGFSVSHALIDGISLWHFVTSWADLSTGGTISVPPVHQRVHVQTMADHSPVAVPAPVTPPPHSPRNGTVVAGAAMFPIPETSIQRIKDEATHHGKSQFSSFLAVMALFWKHMTRARSLDPEQQVSFWMSTDCRNRVNPPLPPGYFGNAIVLARATSTAGEIVSNHMAFAATLLHRALAAVDDKSIKDHVRQDAEAGCPVVQTEINVGADIVSSGSVRFPMYQCDFGWGKPVAVRQGKQMAEGDGLILCDPGVVPGSFGIIVHLYPQNMAALRADRDFIAWLS